MAGDNTEYINLKVVGEVSIHEIHLRVKPTTKMGKAKKSYSERVGVPITSLRFLFNGRRINDAETPNALEIEQDDVIEVKIEEVGQQLVNDNVNELLRIGAAFKNCSEKLKILLDHPDVDANARNSNGETAIMWAALNNISDTLKILLEHPGVDVNARDNYGWTAIMWAAGKNSSEALKLLLNNPDVDANARNNNGETAIMCAASKNSIEALKLLLEHPGVDVNARDNYGDTVIMCAAYKNSSEALKLLLDHPDVDVNARDNNGMTAIVWAADKNSSEALKLLMDKPDVDVNARDNNGYTAIMFSAEDNSSEALEVLLDHPDIDVNVRDNDGMTAIMWAAAVCESKSLKLLLDHPDIDLDVMDNEGKGLEEVVGITRGNTTDKSTCLQMIAVKRSKSCLEEVRNNVRPHLDSVRKEYIDKIDRNNIEIEALKKRNEHIGKRKRELEMEEVESNQKMAKLDMEEVENNRKMTKLKKITKDLDKDLKRFDLDPDYDANSANLEALHKNLECPVCLEMMRPPVRIWMCPASHLVCEPCKGRLGGRVCPTCRTGTVNLRATTLEDIARNLFSN